MRPQAATRDITLDKKTKELIAMGIGIGRMCEGCIMSHVRGALKNGATKEEADTMKKKLEESGAKVEVK